MLAFYSVQQNILAVVPKKETAKRDLIHIPAGSGLIITPDASPVDGRFMEVQWNGTTCLVFPTDLEERACRMN
jgi:hypothetical protein